MIASFLYGNYEAQNVKNMDSDIFYNKIEFSYENNNYSTFENDSLVFIGQTTNNIFVYNKQNQKSTVYFKNDIKNLKFYDPAVLTKKEKKKLELWYDRFKKFFPKNKN